MPRRPHRPCAYPNCPNLAVDGQQYCAEHKRLTNQQYDHYERIDHSKRYGRDWQKIRAIYVRAHPLCEECLKQGRFIPVEEVHHIKPLSQGGTNDENNLMSLCQSCHMKIHLALGDRQTRH